MISTAITVATIAVVRSSLSMAKAKSWSRTRATYQSADGTPLTLVKLMNCLCPSCSASCRPAPICGVFWG
ncbi:hypothetical protein D3C76_1565850 [compost metagenome]